MVRIVERRGKVCIILLFYATLANLSTFILIIG